MKTLYNLPLKVIFCKNCVMSNQRPSSMIEFKHDINRKNAKYLNIDAKTRVCDACKVNEVKKNMPNEFTIKFISVYFLFFIVK